MTDSGRPAWFTGTDEALATLRRAAATRGITLHPQAAPTSEATEELTDELSDILLTENGFDSDWEITPFGDMVEGLIDALNALPD
jgi:MarR-like DNA-binding transcriptional regulator SgrR of sgrS sRNA